MIGSFEHSSTVTGRSPEGKWYEVRIVADDGHKPYPNTFVNGGAFVIVSLFRMPCIGSR